MKSVAHMCVGLGLLLGAGGCASKALPQPLASYPEAIHIVNLKGTILKEDEARTFGWPASPTKTKGKFSRTLSVEDELGPRQVSVNCTFEARQAGGCAATHLSCGLKEGGASFSLMLLQNGRVVYAGPTDKMIDTEQYLALVDMNEAERAGKDFREKAERSLELGDAVPWGVQLAWSRTDPKTNELFPRRVGPPDREFNLLSADKTGVYVSVHRAHPNYQMTLATLATAGHLWANNRGRFEACADQVP